MYTLATGAIFAFSRAEETVEVVAARGKCAHYLGMEEGYPVLRVLSRLFDNAGAVAVASYDSYNPNLVRLTVTSGAMVTENPPARGCGRKVGPDSYAESSPRSLRYCMGLL